MVTQESLLQNIQTGINFLMIIGIAIAVISAIAVLVISLVAGERCKMAFVIGVLIVLIPGLFKLILGMVGQSDKYQLPSGSIALQAFISNLPLLK